MRFGRVLVRWCGRGVGDGGWRVGGGGWGGRGWDWARAASPCAIYAVWVGRGEGCLRLCNESIDCEVPVGGACRPYRHLRALHAPSTHWRMRLHHTCMRFGVTHGRYRLWNGTSRVRWSTPLPWANKLCLRGRHLPVGPPTRPRSHRLFSGRYIVLGAAYHTLCTAFPHLFLPPPPHPVARGVIQPARRCETRVRRGAVPSSEL